MLQTGRDEFAVQTFLRLLSVHTALFSFFLFFFFSGAQNTTFASPLCAAFFQAVRNLVYVGEAAEKRDLLPRGSYFQRRWSLQMPGRKSMNLSFLASVLFMSCVYIFVSIVFANKKNNK